VRQTVRALNPEIPLTFTTMQATIAESVAAPRFRTLLLGIFAGLAVTLAMVGVYGVMSYTVGQRLSEIGLRVALGAQPAHILNLIVSQGLRLTAAGIVTGIVGALFATRLLRTLLFEISPTDP